MPIKLCDRATFDSSHVLLELSISTMMKMGHDDQLVDFARYVRSSGDCALRMLEQHTSLVIDQQQTED